MCQWGKGGRGAGEGVVRGEEANEDKVKREDKRERGEDDSSPKHFLPLPLNQTYQHQHKTPQEEVVPLELSLSRGQTVPERSQKTTNTSTYTPKTKPKEQTNTCTKPVEQISRPTIKTNN